MDPKSQLNGPKTPEKYIKTALCGQFNRLSGNIFWGGSKWLVLNFEMHFVEFQDFGFCMGSGRSQILIRETTIVSTARLSASGSSQRASASSPSRRTVRIICWTAAWRSTSSFSSGLTGLSLSESSCQGVEISIVQKQTTIHDS